MKVNMTPNPLDVVTIHASQGDTEARQWEFELHNNGELIDTSDVKEQLVFKAYKGGTEQILPENGSVPTTSPIIADIKYPHGELTDQEFTYRQSPTEEDGLAKITDIKGNTLVWNQLANVGTLSAIASYSGYLNIGTFSFVANHKYLIKYHQDNTMASNTRNTLQIRFATVGQTVTENATANAHLSQGDYSWLFNSTYTDTNTIVRFWVADNNVAVSYSNIMLFDLTKMGLDITSADEFDSLFPKSYYDYCQGAMLSFGGRNVKFNQLVEKGNMTDGWTFSNSTGSYSNNVLTFTASAKNGFVRPDRPQYIYASHKYFATVDVKATSAFIGRIYFTGHNESFILDPNFTTSWKTFSLVFTNTVTEYNYYPRIFDTRDNDWDAVQVRNCMLIDLTEMFGAGNEPSAQGFLELFPNDYYEYTTGKYMNIGQPASLKTVSKNQFDTQVATTSYQGLTLTKTQGTIRAVYSGGSQYAGFNFYGSPVFTDTFLKGKYRLSFDVKGLDTQWTAGLRQGASFLGGGQAHAISNDGHYSFTIDAEANPNCYLSFARTGNKTTAYDVTFSNIQLELGTTETSYEPYTSSTLSLPISTYFPNGMDGVGTAYDELNNSGYAKRIGQITFDGTQTPVINTVTSTQCRAFYNVSDVLPVTRDSQVIEQDLISNYLPCNSNYHTNLGAEGIHRRIGGQTEICVSLGLNRGITTWDEFKAYLSAHPLTVYYPLNVPLENYGVVDLGTLNWTDRSSTVTGLFSVTDNTISYAFKQSVKALCEKYPYFGSVVSVAQAGGLNDKTIALYYNETGSNHIIYLKDTSFSDVASLKSALSGVYLLYEKENPQGFTTASLVTENAEIPLSNNDGVLIGKCTEQLSENPGFIDAKIKLSDSDGTCYSNKLQLHVERSPQ